MAALSFCCCHRLLCGSRKQLLLQKSKNLSFESVSTGTIDCQAFISIFQFQAVAEAFQILVSTGNDFMFVCFLTMLILRLSE